MKGYWKQPKEKKWWSFIVDGRCIDTLPESADVEKDIRRLKGLAGINIVPATKEQLIKVNAATLLPKRITDKMNFLYRQLLR